MAMLGPWGVALLLDFCHFLEEKERIVPMTLLQRWPKISLETLLETWTALALPSNRQDGGVNHRSECHLRLYALTTETASLVSAEEGPM